MKINTLDKLDDCLSKSLSWRKKELIQMKLFINLNNNPTLIRAGFALLSAHFEGFLRDAANYYVIFISSQKVSYSLLKTSLLALKCKRKICIAGNAKKTSTHTTFLSEIFNLSNEEFSMKYSIDNPIISTESNPSSEVFKEILQTISLNYTPYETKKNYIDADLLKNRNSIVHGEKCIVTKAEYMSTFKEISGIMDMLSKQVLNAAANKEYLK